MASEIYKPNEEILARVKNTVAKFGRSFRQRTIAGGCKGKVYLSTHACMRMAERDIPREVIELAVRYGKKITTHKYMLKYRDLPRDVLDRLGHAKRSQYDALLPVCVILQHSTARAGAFSTRSDYTMTTCYRVADGTAAERPGHRVTWGERRSTNKANRAIRDALYRISDGAPCIMFKSAKAVNNFISRATSFARKHVK